MPIFQTPRGLGYFADVPGCLGPAMIRHLEVRFGPLALHDATHTEAPPVQRWSRTSPQHVGRRTLARLFPPGFFGVSFAVVQHPVERLRSVYVFQRDVEGAIPTTTEFGDWIDDIPERVEEEPFVFDNAIRPMADLVPEDARVFRLEDGLDAVVNWLDEITGTKGPDLALAPTTGEMPDLTWFDCDRIAELHAADYVRFGYDHADRARTSGRAHVFGRRPAEWT